MWFERESEQLVNAVQAIELRTVATCGRDLLRRSSDRLAVHRIRGPESIAKSMATAGESAGDRSLKALTGVRDPLLFARHSGAR